MIVLGRDVLAQFAEAHADVRPQLQAWLAEAEDSEWQSPAEVKRRYPAASLLAGNRVVFNLKGTKYRMLVQIGYQARVVMVQKIGTHAEYSKWEL
ncbi:MAG TPA: type II toxin-antitoxin system HigB family toxin [Terriglobia bacterium]|nr:type II toxin-antitoxin system HigB family toxin [Terriglobia bacterium]